MAAFMEIAPIFKPEFLKDLLDILGEPFSVKFIVSGKAISEEAIRVGKLEGVKLEDRYVGGVPVYLEGKASIERIIEIYKEQYENFRLTVIKRKRFEEMKYPSIRIKEIYWRKWENEASEGYSIKFDEYNLKVEIDPKEEKIISQIVESAKKNDVEVSFSLRQRLRWQKCGST